MSRTRLDLPDTYLPTLWPVWGVWAPWKEESVSNPGKSLAPREPPVFLFLLDCYGKQDSDETGECARITRQLW
jgi:hypothetical protein